MLSMNVLARVTVTLHLAGSVESLLIAVQVAV